MICEQCAKEGATSRVAELPKRPMRGACIEFFDESGEYHRHDASVVITPLHCSRGHTWEHRGFMKCPACGVQVDPSGTDAFGLARS